MTKTKILYSAIFILILLNIGQWFFLGSRRHKPPPRDFIIRKLNLSATQITDYDILIKNHRAAIQATTEEIRVHKNALYQLLKNRNQAAEIQLFAQIAEAQMKIEKLHFEHFLAIKALCTAEQLPLFDELTKELAELFAPPPPPKH
jgi:hypothetical protein